MLKEEVAYVRKDGDDLMMVTVELTKEQEAIVERYAELKSITVEEAFKKALFDQIKKQASEGLEGSDNTQPHNLTKAQAAFRDLQKYRSEGMLDIEDYDSELEEALIERYESIE